MNPDLSHPEESNLLEDVTVDATLAQKLAAEVLGTFVLVLLGCGVAVVTNADVVATALAFGLAVLTMAATVGRISGGHFNPAITLGAALGGRMSWAMAPIYMAAQVVGGILGALVLFIVLHGVEGFDSTGNMGANGFDSAPLFFAWWAAIILEMVLTFIFVMVVLGVTDVRARATASIGPIAIGLTLTMVHLLAIPLTGTSVNPARSIAAALFSGTEALSQLWVFILAPLLGGAIAGLVYPLVFGHGERPVPGSGLPFSITVVAAPQQFAAKPPAPHRQAPTQTSHDQAPQLTEDAPAQPWEEPGWGDPTPDDGFPEEPPTGPRPLI